MSNPNVCLRIILKQHGAILQEIRSIQLLIFQGIAIGLAAFWLIALYVFDELSYDRSFTNAARTYRIAEHIRWDGGAMDFPINPPPLAGTIKAKFPEIEQAINIDAEAGGVIKFNNKIIKQNDLLLPIKASSAFLIIHLLQAMPQMLWRSQFNCYYRKPGKEDI
jgi:putative ABC transport system permease protein